MNNISSGVVSGNNYSNNNGSSSLATVSSSSMQATMVGSNGPSNTAVPNTMTSSSSAMGTTSTTSTLGSASAAASTNKTFRSEVTAIWELNEKQLESWIRSSSLKLSPPQLLFRNSNNSPSSPSTAPTPPTTTSSMNGSGNNLPKRIQQQQHEYIHMALWKNVKQAMDSLKMIPIPKKKPTNMEIDDDDQNDDDEEEQTHSSKRMKREGGAATKKKSKKFDPERFQRHDPYLLWLHVPPPDKDASNGEDFMEGEDEDVIPDALGGRIAQLGVAGFLNAMALIPNGHVHNKNLVEPKEDDSKNKILFSLEMPTSLSYTTENDSKVFAINALQLHRLAVTWHRVIQAKVREDILITTPLRIQDMLAADLTAQEFASIRKRVYDTVVLGKGIHTNDYDNGDDTLATAQAPTGAVLEAEKFKKCPSCGNNDQSTFVLDRKNGDVICQNCGTVVSESLMHEGSQYRKFEGEVDRNHHGDAANPLYSNAHNMSTSLSGVQQASGAGIGGWRSGGGGGGRNLETILRNAHDYIELNVSQLGKTDRRTRTGYKDRQKRDAFIQMGHVGDALNLHEAVVQRAKELFAGFRDDRELLQQCKGVIAACLCEAFEQLSTAGKSIIKGDVDTSNNTNNNNNKSDTVDEPAGFAAYSTRAARRNELHHAKLAGKGGLLLDFSNIAGLNTSDDKNSHTPVPQPQQLHLQPLPDSSTIAYLENTPATAWDLEHCRSWLLEASRRIAQQWVDERNKAATAPTYPQQRRIPSGTLEELEGTLVEHTFTICEQLEAELLARDALHTRRTATPRVNNMDKVGIKWQHSHERGSGGKGGVGGSGNTTGTSDRTAGQSLILMTAKKLGSMLNDSVAGEAIHKELRGVVAKQEAQKLKDRRQEASRQRLLQMKRKPYLLARVQSET